MTRSDRLRHLDNARQIAAIFTAFMLPISTSLQAIGVTILALLSIEAAARDRDHLRATLQQPAAFLPIALFTLILLGVTWSMLPLNGALKWVGPYGKLLLIPLLMATRYTARQLLHLAVAFLVGCFILMVLSYASILWPSGPWGRFFSIGVPVKDNAVQSECFALCMFGLLYCAYRFWMRGSRKQAIAAGLVALMFLANIFVLPVISRTAVLVALALIALLGIQLLGLRRAALFGLPILLIGVMGLSTLPRVQNRIHELALGFTKPTDAEATSTASRLDFWTKSKSFIAEAPLIGHGTGSIRPLFQSREEIAPSPYGAAVADPHNQILHTVLQVGLVGGVILLAMWLSHGALFFARDSVSMFGLAVVTLIVIGSMFNSHISQVTQGMLYCMAMGMIGSNVLSRRIPAPSTLA